MKTEAPKTVDYQKVGVLVGTEVGKTLVRIAFVAYFGNKTRAALKKDKLGFRDAYVISSLVAGLAVGGYEAVENARRGRLQYYKGLSDAGITTYDLPA